MAKNATMLKQTERYGEQTVYRLHPLSRALKKLKELWRILNALI